jgi:hypothetical protein
MDIYIYTVIMNDYVKPIYYRIPANRYWWLATLASGQERLNGSSSNNGATVRGPQQFKGKWAKSVWVPHSSTWNYKWI